jgi:ABC-type branched-subunit amino acid transport system substrate-binding protein
MSAPHRLASRKKAASAIVAAALLSVAACGSSSSGGSGGGGSSSAPSGGSSSGGTTGKTVDVTVGVLADITGLGASGNKTTVEGVKAGTIYATRNGVHVKYIVGDTATNPATALSAAQKFVTQDHVDAVIAVSSLTFAAAPYLTAHKVPVIGAGEDGPEWTKATNMFSVFGALNTTKVTDTLGKFYKMEGVTTVGAVGYSISPLSSEAAKASIESAKSVGLKDGYLNANFPFGSTDVQPVALAMKSAGVDGFTATTDPNTGFALVSSLRQEGANVKVAIFATGYGGDLLQAGPGALQAAQNVYFSLGYEPIEMQTTATKQFASDLKSAGVNSQATYAEYNGYVSVGLLVRALKANGGNTSQASIISTLQGVHDWDALGLFGGRKLDINDRTNIVGGVDNCSWVTKLQGSKFTLVKGADPICGKVLDGVTVSPSS